jgi:hypothetical protein
MRRSQAIQPLPVDSTLAKLVLHNGERSDVLLFIQPGEDITRLVSPGAPFVPMVRNAQFCMVARDAIAALGLVTGDGPSEADRDGLGLPMVHRRTRISLRSGAVLEGELQWIPIDDHKRIADHVNEPASFLVVHATEIRTIYYVAKAQIAVVEELA